MKFLQRIKRIFIGLSLVLVAQLWTGKNLVVESFIPDVISAATDGSECTDPSWIGCSVGWLEKGYVYDKAKGYYVKPSGVTTTTKVTTQKTTKAVTQTTKSSTAVTSKPANTTKPSTTITTKPITTDAKPEESVSINSQNNQNSSTSEAPDSKTTKVSYTKRSRPARTTAAESKKTSNNSGLDISFLSNVSFEWLVGGLVLIIIMVSEFFIVRSIYKKD